MSNSDEAKCLTILKKWSERSPLLLKQISNLNQISLEYFEPNFPVLEHFRTSCSLNLKDFRIEFRIYFTTEDGMTFCGQTSHLPTEFLSQALIIDFTKEFANHMVGSIKQDFEKLNLSSVISLPIQIRSFDELFFKKKRSVESSVGGSLYYDLFWKLKSGESKLLFGLSMEVFEPAMLNVLNEDGFSSGVELGSFEVL